jgi:hypothetical protein
MMILVELGIDYASSHNSGSMDIIPEGNDYHFMLFIGKEEKDDIK